MIKCKLCGRVFDAPTPHKCNTGFRKKKFQWEGMPETRLFIMPDDTFFVRLYSFIKDIETCDWMGDEEHTYLTRTVLSLLKEQIRTAKGKEVEYLKRCHPEMFAPNCEVCENLFSNPFDQFYCHKGYDLQKYDDCKGEYFKVKVK